MRVLLILLFSSLLFSVSAQETSPGSFLDQYYLDNKAKTDALGISVSLVRDGYDDLVKGFGMANLANQTPVSGQNTVFRIASVSKVFISIAVLQQVEKGALDLDTDVNQYLEFFKVPQTFSEPITLRHLLTHTAGFEEVQ